MDLADAVAIEVEDKIRADIDVYGGELPDRFSIAWHGYLRGIRDWGLIGRSSYKSLTQLLTLVPGIDDVWRQPNGREGGQQYGHDGYGAKHAIAARIQSALGVWQGTLPEMHALAWKGYVAGLLDQGVIDWAGYRELDDLLPSIACPNPIATIFSGRIYVDELQPEIEADMQQYNGNLPEQIRVAWAAYLRGLVEYGAISSSTCDALTARLQPIQSSLLDDDLVFTWEGIPKCPDQDMGKVLMQRLSIGKGKYQNDPPDRFTIIWMAYLLGLIKWLVIDYDLFSRLTDQWSTALIPKSIVNTALGKE